MHSIFALLTLDGEIVGKRASTKKERKISASILCSAYFSDLCAVIYNDLTFDWKINVFFSANGISERPPISARISPHGPKKSRKEENTWISSHVLKNRTKEKKRQQSPPQHLRWPLASAHQERIFPTAPRGSAVRPQLGSRPLSVSPRSRALAAPAGP